MVLELSRYLLRSIVTRPGEADVEHIRVGGVEFLFFRVAKVDQKNLTERDKEALVLVVERVGKKIGREIIADWR